MATEPVTLMQVKMHLRLDEEDTSQDAYLDVLLSAARRSIENATGRTIGGAEPKIVEADYTIVTQAMLLLVGHWFVNREVTGKDTSEMPLAVHWLIAPLRIWHV